MKVAVVALAILGIVGISQAMEVACSGTGAYSDVGVKVIKFDHKNSQASVLEQKDLSVTLSRELSPEDGGENLGLTVVESSGFKSTQKAPVGELVSVNKGEGSEVDCTVTSN